GVLHERNADPFTRPPAFRSADSFVAIDLPLGNGDGFGREAAAGVGAGYTETDDSRDPVRLENCGKGVSGVRLAHSSSDGENRAVGDFTAPPLPRADPQGLDAREMSQQRRQLEIDGTDEDDRERYDGGRDMRHLPNVPVRSARGEEADASIRAAPVSLRAGLSAAALPLVLASLAGCGSPPPQAQPEPVSSPPAESRALEPLPFP